MSADPEYSKYQPRLYHERTPIFWWVHRWPSVRFILRELTSLWVAFFAVMLLLEAHAILRGPEAFREFQSWLATPFSVVLHAIALLFVLFHSITWFNLAPKALVVRLGRIRIPGFLIAAMNYAAWLFVSAAIAWLLLHG